MGAAQEGVGLYVIEQLLDDADLFRRLRLRGEARGADGLPDLLAALRLVHGTPYADRGKNSRPWLTDRRPDLHLQTAVVDVAHLVTSIALKAGDLHQARAAAELALLIAPDDTTPALDLANVAIKQGREDEAAALARQLPPSTDIVNWTDTAAENRPPNSPNAPTASSAPTAGSNQPNVQAEGHWRGFFAEGVGRRTPTLTENPTCGWGSPAPAELGMGVSHSSRAIAVVHRLAPDGSRADSKWLGLGGCVSSQGV